MLPEASLSRFVFSVKSLLFQKRKTQQPPEQLGEIGIIRSFKSVSRAVNICRCSCLALNLASSKPLVHCLTLNYHISKTALTPCTDDEIFNDAWVSALHQPESCSSYCDVPWGPRLPDQRPSQQSLDLVSRKLAPGTHLKPDPELAGQHSFSCTSLPSVKREILKNGAAICTPPRSFK